MPSNFLPQESFRDIQKAIGGPFECLSYTLPPFAGGRTLYVDRDGLHRGWDEQHWFRLTGIPDPITGRALILGRKGKADTDAKLRAAQIAANVEWLPAAEFAGLVGGDTRTEGNRTIIDMGRASFRDRATRHVFTA